MQEVDFWDIYDNSNKPRVEIARGGKGADTIVFDKSLFYQVKRYVK